MARILAVGIATLDIINTVTHYPGEDEELRAETHSVSRGGNATNTLVILDQLGHQGCWAGVLPQDTDAALVLQDLDRYKIDIQAVYRPVEGKLPTSYITLSKATGSRSIIHYRDCPEYDFKHFDELNLESYDWVHFEGRNVSQLKPMMDKVRKAGIACSLEVEKPRKGIEALFAVPEVLMFSRAYANSRGYHEAASFLVDMPGRRKRFVAWGEAGAWGLDESGDIAHHPAAPVKVVDSVGAGDVFNAGIIHGLLRELPLGAVLTGAVRLASDKCTHRGLDLGL